MFDEVRLVDVMAESLGIKRIKGEGERPFVIRCLYSACRFWVEAFCLDDGYLPWDSGMVRKAEWR